MRISYHLGVTTGTRIDHFWGQLVSRVGAESIVTHCGYGAPSEESWSLSGFVFATKSDSETLRN